MTLHSIPATAERIRLQLCAGLLVMSLFVASWLGPIPGGNLARALVAFAAVIALLIAVERTADPGQKLSSRPRWRIHRAPVDRRRLNRSLGEFFLNAFLVAAALCLLLQTRPPRDAVANLLRPAAGVALLYGVAGVNFAVWDLCFLAKGYTLPVVHRTPVAARSLSEFWGQRWNILVSAWLHTYVFRPMARRHGPRVGVLSCFVVSGVIHAWPMLAGVGLSAAVSTTAFFVIQGLLVLVENQWQIAAWPPAASRAWTLIILLTTSPLYIDPGLRLFGL